MVDAGAGYLALPNSLAKELELQTIGEMKVTLADRRELVSSYTVVHVEIMEREVPALALLMDTPEPLLGSFALETLGLEVDPAKEEVRPTRSFAVGLFTVRGSLGSTIFSQLWFFFDVIWKCPKVIIPKDRIYPIKQ